MNSSAELSPSQILERVKPDRVTITKPEEDRRRRTIIVEKKNGSYGFTLQSYGIHYKKEQEIEVITYVDHVDYDGPAFRAGMREGDVILSINGRDMEKVDHKSLVNFIKSCDARMRMVVLFEDCVRKVELHMKYIKLQDALKAKTLELEKLCLQEKELMSGKWKTHSLPARKKTNSATKTSEYGSKVPTDNEDKRLNRSTQSTEDVGHVQLCHRVQHHLLISYPRHPPYYIDSHCRAYYVYPSIVASPSSSKEYLVKTASIQSSRHHLDSNSGPSNYLKDTQRRRSSYATNDSKLSNSRENLRHHTNNFGHNSRASSKHRLNDSSTRHEVHKITRSKSYHQRICGGCLRGDKNGQDNAENGGVLEAYDLASTGSPCCSAECVPTRRRRSHSHHGTKLKHSSSKTSLQSCNTNRDYSEGHSNRSTQVNISTSFQGNGYLRKHSATMYEGIRKQDPAYQNLLSQHSLQSCTSSELPPSQGVAADHSVASYTTSISTDTLYWDQPSSLQSSRKPSTKSSSTTTGRYNNHQHHVKSVKSWDNLASVSSKSHNSRGSCDYLDCEGKSYSTKNVSQLQQQHHRDRYFDPNKSSESLFYSQNLSESSFSCEYLSQDNPTFISNEEGRFVPIMPSEVTGHHDKASQTDSSKRLVDVPQKPEITRL